MTTTRKTAASPQALRLVQRLQALGPECPARRPAAVRRMHAGGGARLRGASAGSGEVNVFAMTYRAANGQRMTQHLHAIDRQAATNQAFDLAERLTGAPCGFGIAPVQKGHTCS